MGGTRFEAAIAAIDAANRDDPNTIEIGGERRPKELAHAERVSDWVRRLAPDASEPLLLAARAHHVKRWEIPRASYPMDRPGYLRWRRDLQKLHAELCSRILSDVGYETPTIRRVQDILRKRGLGRDDEVQTFEDALCLTFLETQLGAFADQHPGDKASDVLRKTLAKMSPPAREAARHLPVPATLRSLIDAAAR